MSSDKNSRLTPAQLVSKINGIRERIKDPRLSTSERQRAQKRFEEAETELRKRGSEAILDARAERAYRVL